MNSTCSIGCFATSLLRLDSIVGGAAFYDTDKSEKTHAIDQMATGYDYTMVD